ncbi:hypothetical protein M0R45_006380 [Rubus argutus]|uniref:Uncharacterized protein n=1 Tax=Rubus argutus TaxID=59490 RepID=A0AAW1YQW5_RUBAR
MYQFTIPFHHHGQSSIPIQQPFQTTTQKPPILHFTAPNHHYILTQTNQAFQVVVPHLCTKLSHELVFHQEPKLFDRGPIHHLNPSLIPKPLCTLPHNHHQSPLIPKSQFTIKIAPWPKINNQTTYPNHHHTFLIIQPIAHTQSTPSPKLFAVAATADISASPRPPLLRNTQITAPHSAPTSSLCSPPHRLVDPIRAVAQASRAQPSTDLPALCSEENGEEE